MWSAHSAEGFFSQVVLTQMHQTVISNNNVIGRDYARGEVCTRRMPWSKITDSRIAENRAEDTRLPRHRLVREGQGGGIYMVSGSLTIQAVN
jgi:hypothetical protein